MEQFEESLRRWDEYKRLNADAAYQIEELAEKLLVMDHIDQQGIQKLFESSEMVQLKGLLKNNPEAAQALGIKEVSSISILRTIDLHAAARIFKCER